MLFASGARAAEDLAFCNSLVGAKSRGRGEYTGPFFGCAFVTFAASGEGTADEPDVVSTIVFDAFGAAGTAFGVGEKLFAEGRSLVTVDPVVVAFDTGNEDCELGGLASDTDGVVAPDEFGADSVLAAGGETRAVAADAAGVLVVVFFWLCARCMTSS